MYHLHSSICIQPCFCATFDDGAADGDQRDADWYGDEDDDDLLIRGAIFRLELSGRPSKFNTDSMWPIYWSDNTEDNMQMMICCISKGHKIYESIQAHTSNAHIAMH